MELEMFIRKRYQTLLAVSLLPFLSTGAAYHVSKEPQTKHILFEEATGIECTSCPMIAPDIEKIGSTYPGTNIIAIHGHHYRNSFFDLTTPGGDEIVDYFDIMSYPQAMVNRRKFDNMDRRFMSSVFWPPFLASENETDAPVNLWINSWLNEETGIVKVEVEGYCLADISAENPYLTVVMTQDGLIGPQKGQSMPSYTHNHVLRDFITPTWGIPITNTLRGDYFSVSFDYPLPEKIGIYEVVPGNLKFIAFVTEEKINVMNSTSSTVTYEPPEVLPDDPDDDDFITGVRKIADAPDSYSIYDLNGRLILQSNTPDIPSSLSSGIYIMKSHDSVSKLIVP